VQEIIKTTPFVINKNLGSAMLAQAEDLTSTNADGMPVVPLTQKQMYNFDRNGWLLIPGVLEGSELEEMQAYAERLHRDPECFSEAERSTLAGPLQKLMDHPVVVGFLNEFLAYPPCASEESYGFRLETSNLMFRSARAGEQRKFSPHNGNGLFRPPWDSHYYRCVPGKAWSGLTRVALELNPVKYREGGTLFITGSHKSAYPAPASAMREDSPVWDTYECPAGSVVIFTEAISHSASTWTNEDNDRLAVFNLYNTVANRWQSWLPDSDLLASMHPKRQSLFREVKAAGNVENGAFQERTRPYAD
jgi:hypothetical protein